MKIIDEITYKICESNLSLRTRVNLQLEKPEIFCNTPDLLYALYLYLTGDTGANAIQITGVNEEESAFR